MFSGIIHEMGSVVHNTIETNGRLTVAAVRVLQGVRIGDSIAVNGCCLTVVTADAARFAADIMPETARRTNLGALGEGDRVNLEAAMALGDRLGGHMLSGHIDGVGEIASIREEGNALRVRVTAPDSVVPYLVDKGCVAADGISLTVVDATDTGFIVFLTPHTRAVTGAGEWITGRRLNLEADLVAKYVERGLRAYAPRWVTRSATG